uniref:YjbQ family protein n=1 Tax=Dictyoglomus thermophilum TaxID=14 RepID=A0A7C3RW98_DICTH
MFYEISVSTPQKVALVDITDKIEEAIKKSNVKNGICFIFVPHTTAGILINENYDPSVVRDIISTYDKIVPSNIPYAHAEGNSPAHIKSTIVGTNTFLFVREGKLNLGTWQGVFLAEFDGPRYRKVWVDIWEEKE